MLMNNLASAPDRISPPRAQSGVVLIIALIILIAMTLAGVAMIRSVDLGNIIAGNLAFRQTATHAADTGIETAFATFLGPNRAGTLLFNDHADQGYSANGNDPLRSPAAGVTWETYWATQTVQDRVRTITPDTLSGYTVSYIIDRLCAIAGDPNGGANCLVTPVSAVYEGQQQEGGELAIKPPSPVYYRITVRVVGPRNTVSFVQAVVAM
jgi:Tfp pilus assembly protein PilX